MSDTKQHSSCNWRSCSVNRLTYEPMYIVWAEISQCIAPFFSATSSYITCDIFLIFLYICFSYTAKCLFTHRLLLCFFCLPPGLPPASPTVCSCSGSCRRRGTSLTSLVLQVDSPFGFVVKLLKPPTTATEINAALLLVTCSLWYLLPSSETNSPVPHPLAP